MQSSAPGRGASGATNPIAASTSQRPTSDSRASSESFIQEGTGHIAPNLDGATAASAAWYYQSGTQPSAGDERVQPPASSSSSTMIGPTFTSYNAENAPFNEDESANYQQWINSYNQQAQLQPQQQQAVYGASYRQDAPAIPPSEAQATPLSQNPYSFMQNQYTTSNTANQYGGSTSTTALRGGLDSTSFQTQGTDVYPSYYAEILAMNTNSTSNPDQPQSYQESTPESTLHSYSNSPDPLYQQPQHQPQLQPQQHIQHHPPHVTNQQPRFQQQPQVPQQPQSHQQQRHIPQQQHVQPQQAGPRQQQPPNQQQHVQQYQGQTQSQKPQVPQPPQRFIQQQLNPPVVANRQAQKPQAKTSDFQQPPPQPVRFAAPRNPPEQAPLASQPIPTSTQRPAVAPPLAPQWNPEGNFQPKKPAPASTVIHQYVPPSSANFGAAKAGPSQPKPPSATNTPLKRATAPSATEENANSSPGNKASAKRKRFKKNDSPQEGSYGGGDSESDSDEDLDGLGMSGRIEVGLGGLGVVGKGKKDKGSRLPGACTHCKKLKMRCDFPKNEDTCKRCKTGGHACIVEGRRPRTAPNKREYLLAQIRQKDAIIESLLKQLHNPYIATPLSIASYRMATSPSDQNNRNLLAWLDRLQSSVRDAGKKGGPGAFLDVRNSDEAEESDPESESKRNQAGEAKDDASTAADAEDGDGDDLQTSLPDSHVPLGLIADLSLSNSKAYRKKDAKDARLAEEDYNDDNVGVANATYFMPGPATDLGIRATLIEQHSAPEILVHGLVKPEDVEKLFQIFYERVNPFISLLDPVLHTPASTFARCPFLFTVICAISSRYYAEKSEIYPIAMHFAKHSAANALIDGWKSVELCQAYILMSIYAVPARRWEEDRSWLYTGLAIRIATDLNLHQVSTVKPTSENQEREILNKTRVWMICFNLDRSTATQFGKPSTIKEDFIVRSATDWYKKSQYNLKYDVHLCAYAALLQIVAKFHDEIFSDPTSPTGLNKKVDFRSVTLAHDAHLTSYHEEWSRRFKEDSDPDDSTCVIRCLLLPFLVGYSRLVMFSFGFQQAYQRGFQDGDRLFFSTCLDAAKSVLENMIDGLAPSGYMRYAPDGHFVFASFASAFLLKLLRPEFSSFLAKDQESEIFDLIGRLIQTLSSPKIAIDDRHTPRLYARFLAGLLSRHRRDGATVGRLQTNPPPSSALSASTQANASTFGSSAPQASEQPFGHSSALAIQASETPIYTPEATFAASTGQISFGADYEMSYSASEEEVLATMQAIKNPAWWQTMMMPGFSWPEASPSPPMNGVVNTVYPSNIQPQSVLGASGFGIFHGTQVMM